jgi:hypothetical protein
MALRDRLAHWSCVELEALQTPRRRLLTATLPLNLSALSALGSVASLFSVYLAFSPPAPERRWYIAVGAIGLLLLVTATSGIALRREHRRRRMYQQASNPLHLLTHHLRDRVRPDVLRALAQLPSFKHANNPVLNGVLFALLSDVADVFQSLVRRGTVQVGLLRPVALQPGQTEPTHMILVMWSRLRGSAIARRGPKGQRRQPTYAISESIAGRVFQTRHSILIRDTRIPNQYSVVPFRFAKSLVSVPIVLDRIPEFVLSIDCDEPRQFHADYIELARMAADLLATFFRLADQLSHSTAETGPRSSVPSTPTSP